MLVHVIMYMYKIYYIIGLVAAIEDERKEAINRNELGMHIYLI